MKQLFIFLLVTYTINTHAQIKLIAGPMLGDVDYRAAIIWAEFEPGKMANLSFWNKNTPALKTIVKPTNIQNAWVGPVKYYVVGLQPGNTYQYAFSAAALPSTLQKTQGSFTTKTLWQWRKPAPDFSFLTGSCAYINDPLNDRPGKPYGGDSSIFETMAKENAAFMLWLGDSWYTREVDYGSAYGLYYRASHDRAQPILNNFLKAMPHYAIWDDHDFGPNDCSSNYIFKDESKKVFDSYFANPTSGQDGKGIYTKISYNDCDLFMLDGRYFKTSDKLKDSINGQPNADKFTLGKQQMDWLKNALLASNDNNRPGSQTTNASFKIICIGSQVLNTLSPYEKFNDYKTEYNDLINFIKEYKINGVVFLTGDRHYTEIIKQESNNFYPLYDITISALTSGSASRSKPEKDNPNGVLYVEKVQNYGKLSVTGLPGNRVLTVNVIDKKGAPLASYAINQKELLVR